jgi:hypothetical protein
MRRRAYINARVSSPLAPAAINVTSAHAMLSPVLRWCHQVEERFRRVASFFFASRGSAKHARQTKVRSLDDRFRG